MQRCLRAIEDYDFVILPPWYSFPLEQSKDGVLTRNMDELDQLSIHAAMVGYAHMWVSEDRVIQIPRALDSLVQRLDLIDHTIRERKPGLLAL